MSLGLLGKKLGMSQVFEETGRRTAVTLIEVGPCTVVQKKSVATDSYNALQIGFEDRTAKNLNKPSKGRFDKVGVSPKRYLREFRVEADVLEKYEVGQSISVSDLFSEGDVLDVRGTSKGHGFTGVFKRYHYHGAPASHGHHEVYRHQGSLGTSAWPSRVVKGKRMPGQDGNFNVTTQNLKVVLVDAEKNLLALKGSVPGPKHRLVRLDFAIKSSS
jgi:large subunit ribosomal protein L3